MKKAIIIHTVEQAEHCIKNGLNTREIFLFSTHSSVETYLRERHGVECPCLSSFLRNEEIFNLRRNTDTSVELILKTLDKWVSPQIHEKSGVSISWFLSLYSYYGKYHYIGYEIFMLSFRKFLEIEKPESIALYPYRFDGLISTKREIFEVAQKLFPTVRIESITMKESHPFLKRLRNAFRKSLNNPSRALERIKEKLFPEKTEKLRIDPKKPVILIAEPLGEFSAVYGELQKRYNILYYQAGSLFPKGFSTGDTEKVSSLILNFGDVANELKKDLTVSVNKLFFEDVTANFSRVVNEFLGGLAFIKNWDKTEYLQLGIWGGPPVTGFVAILFEYLRSKGNKVIGYQHGSTYGDSWEPWHFDSDFTRCDSFISYGFTSADIYRQYPEKILSADIYPYGKSKISISSESAKKIDILFPLTNSISIFEAGATRLLAHELTIRQIRLLEFLNSLEHCSVYVKLFPYANSSNCSVLPVLKRLKNIRVINNVGYSQFLETHSPAAVLIEFPSTPLFESIHLDTEIFVMNDTLHPFETEALEALKKRAYYTESTEEMVDLLRRFAQKTLGKKRDNTFLNRYVMKENTKRNVLNLIEKTIANA